MVPGVVDKCVPISNIASDLVTSELFIQDELERQSAYNLLRALVTSMQCVIRQPLSRATLPPSVVLRPLENASEKKVTLASGLSAIVDLATCSGALGNLVLLNVGHYNLLAPCFLNYFV